MRVSIGARRRRDEELGPEQGRATRGAGDELTAVLLGDHVTSVERVHHDPPAGELDARDEVARKPDRRARRSPASRRPRRRRARGSVECRRDGPAPRSGTSCAGRRTARGCHGSRARRRRRRAGRRGARRDSGCARRGASCLEADALEPPSLAQTSTAGVLLGGDQEARVDDVERLAARERARQTPACRLAWFARTVHGARSSPSRWRRSASDLRSARRISARPNVTVPAIDDAALRTPYRTVASGRLPYGKFAQKSTAFAPKSRLMRTTPTVSARTRRSKRVRTGCEDSLHETVARREGGARKEASARGASRRASSGTPSRRPAALARHGRSAPASPRARRRTRRCPAPSSRRRRSRGAPRRACGGHRVVSSIHAVVGPVEAQQPAKLLERPRRVVDAKVHDPIGPRLVRGPGADDEQRSRLHPTDVAPHALRGLEGGQEALGERPLRALERPGHRLGDLAGEHEVRLHRVAVAGAVPRGRDAVRPRVDCDSAPCVHQGHLPDSGRGVRGKELARAPFPEPFRPGAPRAPSTRTTAGRRTASRRHPLRPRPTARRIPTENQWLCTATPSSPVGGVPRDDRVGGNGARRRTGRRPGERGDEKCDGGDRRGHPVHVTGPPRRLRRAHGRPAGSPSFGGRRRPPVAAGMSSSERTFLGTNGSSPPPWRGRAGGSGSGAPGGASAGTSPAGGPTAPRPRPRRLRLRLRLRPWFSSRSVPAVSAASAPMHRPGRRPERRRPRPRHPPRGPTRRLKRRGSARRRTRLREHRGSRIPRPERRPREPAPWASRRPLRPPPATGDAAGGGASARPPPDPGPPEARRRRPGPPPTRRPRRAPPATRTPRTPTDRRAAGGKRAIRRHERRRRLGLLARERLELALVAEQRTFRLDDDPDVVTLSRAGAGPRACGSGSRSRPRAGAPRACGRSRPSCTAPAACAAPTSAAGSTFLTRPYPSHVGQVVYDAAHLLAADPLARDLHQARASRSG